MRLFRHGPLGSEAAGAVDARGVKRDISLLAPDFTPDWLSPEKLNALSAIDLEKMPEVPEGTRVGAPVAGSRQFIAIGLNYRQHAAEIGHDDPKDPLVFNKAITCIQGPTTTSCSRSARKRSIGKSNSVSHRDQGPACEPRKMRSNMSPAIASPMTSRSATGRPIAADSGSRARASTRSGRWAPGSSRRTRSPTRRIFPISLSSTAMIRQKSNTSDMIFSVAEIVSHLSQFMTFCRAT